MSAMQATSPLYGLEATQARIEHQAARVAKLTPGSTTYEAAVGLLVALRMSAETMVEARRIMAVSTKPLMALP